MEGSGLHLLLLQLCLAALVHSQPQCTMIIPNLLRVDSEETVVIEVYNHNNPINVDITVQDFPQKKLILFTTKIDLNQGNNFLGTAQITVPPKELKKDAKGKQFVFVTAKSAVFQVEKVVLVSFHSGYVFIQADKTIYTPGSTVYYRMFTMGHKLQPVAKTLIVEFENPDGIIVKRDTVIGESKGGGIFSQSYILPELVNVGTWTIAATFQDSPLQNYTTQFDVKEYVLPSMEVKVEPQEPFFYVDAPKLDVDITARFLYGKPVDGDAFILFGVMIDGERKSIPRSLQRVEIRDGHGQGELTRDMLTDRFKDINELIDHSIYVSVTVLTNTGSDMVETEKTDIYIVKSPYKILFTKTSKYFKPGMPFDLTVFVTNPDGSPAHRIKVRAGDVSGSTLNDGTTKLTINTAATAAPLTINVETDQPPYPKDRQAKAQMVANPYSPQAASKNYLHIGVTSNELKPGDTLNVNFNVRNDDLNIQNQIKYFTYLIMSKGKVYKVARQAKQAGQALVTMTLSITPEYIPSFRLIGYYCVGNEIVADSVWVDVKDSCMGTLVVSGATDRDNKIHEPGKSMKLKLRGDHRAKVGLVAVDKGVYVLNKKHKISQSKVWDAVEKTDIGCTPGGGANNVGVFSDAGLALETNFKISTPQRTEPLCQQPGKRRRRSVQLVQYKATKAAEYKGGPRKCCEDGMYENPMGHSCERRARYIKDTKECMQAFLACCEFISKLRVERRREQLILARSDSEDGYLSEDEVISRTEFPESWFWKVEDLVEAPDKDGISTKVMSVFLKDSITTWEVLAVSLSENKGICVADPYEITVMKDFFIDLRLPYSVIRNEQVEIRAVLYNYHEDDIKVRIELTYNEKICSASTSKKKYRQELELQGKSSTAVPFILVPLEIGLHDIEVKAYVFDRFIGDGVKKKLKVVAEGMKINKTVTVVTLDPAGKGIGGVQHEKVTAADLKDKVPKTDSETIVSVQGTPITQLVENSIDGANLHHLIVVPRGCGEQNMITMTPAVIATHYLDNTGQWERLGVNRRAEAIKYIQQGYTQQLVYRQPQSCYAAWTNRPGSTWLTAYVAKVFSMASSLIDIQKDVVCGAVKWLILEKQKPDGIFQEDAPVIHGEMVGGYRGAEPEASLTAFVLIAMAQSREICADQVNSLEGSILKASEYLARAYPTLTKPYSIAITAYALAMVDKLPKSAKLMDASTDKTHWKDPSNNLFSIEATSYAMLALLRTKEFEHTGRITRWLTEQRYYGGVYGSTQATIMVFQALAQYEIDSPGHKELDLDIAIKLPGRSLPINYRINFENALVTRSAETKLNQDFTVEAKGKGQGTLTVVTVYNAMVSDKQAKCNMFDLTVTVTPDRSGRKQEGLQKTVIIEVCTRYLGVTDSTMTILDIAMLTGFSPDIEELRRLSEPVDRYISKFEVEKGLSDKGRLIIYLDKVSNKETECLEFRAHQHFPVGLIQPAAVKVYEYYALENSCTKFYHPDKESGLLSKICQGDVCRCAEENCYMQKFKDGITWQDRVEKACEPGVDYVYKTKLTKIETTDSYDNYLMTIDEVIKTGSDEAPLGKMRRFISHQKCRDALKLKEDKDYLIWGLNTDLWIQPGDISYNIGKDTWIEWWPNEEECQDEQHEEICQEFSRFSDNMKIFGCPN